MLDQLGWMLVGSRLQLLYKKETRNKKQEEKEKDEARFFFFFFFFVLFLSSTPVVRFKVQETREYRHAFQRKETGLTKI
jgi:hypothetical protein